MIVASLAILWAARWYFTKQHLKLQEDNLSYGNVMKRSRHSIHLSSTHAAESVGQVGDENTNKDHEVVLLVMKEDARQFLFCCIPEDFTFMCFSSIMNSQKVGFLNNFSCFCLLV